MQVPQLFRRGVIRPLDDPASEQLAGMWITTSIRCEWLPVLGDEEFARIWQSGVLQAINLKCGTDISDYEEVELTVEQAQTAAMVIGNTSFASDHATVAFFQSLNQLLTAAITSNRRVYFVF